VKIRYLTSVVALLFFIVIPSGCGPRYVTFTTSPKWAEIRVVKVAAIPFAFAPLGEMGDSRIARVDPEGRVCYDVDTQAQGLRSGRVAPEGVAQITGMFLRGMERLGYSIISYDGETKEMLSLQGTLPIDVVKAIGEKTGAEAVLTGIVTRYEEREGGPLGVRKPASVGFEVNLTSTLDGTLLWHSRYAETQKSLVEDLGMIFTFFKRRGRWLTADELAREGVEEVLKTLPRSPLVHSSPVY